MLRRFNHIAQVFRLKPISLSKWNDAKTAHKTNAPIRLRVSGHLRFNNPKKPLWCLPNTKRKGDLAAPCYLAPLFLEPDLPIRIAAVITAASVSSFRSL